MKYKTKIIGSILFKAIGFFLAGILVSMAMLADTDTMAWFSSRVVSNLQVQAASAQDIIEGFYTLSDVSNNSGENPDKIIVKKAEGLTYDPVVYFSVDGDASRYIMHINPAKLTRDEIQIPIKLKINYRDLADILGKSSITGKITLKYLNEFIVDSFQITFTRGYLLAQYLGLQDRQLIAKYNSNFDIDRELTPYAAQVINGIAGNIRWHNVVESGRVQKLEKESASNESVGDGMVVSTFSMTPAAMNRARMTEPVTIGLPKIQLTDEQQSIINVITPGLMDYIDALYGYAEDLIAQLNEKIAKIDELNLTIDGMYTQIQGLNAAVDDLTQKYAALEQEKVALLQEKLDLEQENMKLKDKIEDLKDEIDSLKNKNDSLEDKIGNLESANDSLKEEIRKLQEQNENLTKEIENLKNSAPSGSGSGNSAPGGSTQPSDGSEPPTGTPPPAVEPPDGGSKDSGTEQPPVQEPGEQPPAGQEPGAEEPPAEESGAEEPDPPSSGEQPPAGDSLKEDPAGGDFIEKPPAETPSPYVETPENGDPSFDEQPATESPAEEETPAGEPDPQEGSPQAEDVLIAP
ncbi:MAG TPA: hypothetical protein GXX35_05580 [Thermoanaerobacterales bacterium]|nr:hypothetical protein [Thermoanaerobacterales bacterium]